MIYPRCGDGAVDARRSQDQACAIGLAERLACEQRGGGSRDDKRLESDSAENVGGGERAPLGERALVEGAGREQVGDVEADRLQDFMDRAAGAEIVEQNPAIIHFPNAQAWPLVGVCRAAGQPAAGARALYLVEFRQKNLGAHLRAARSQPRRGLRSTREGLATPAESGIYFSGSVSFAALLGRLFVGEFMVGRPYAPNCAASQDS